MRDDDDAQAPPAAAPPVLHPWLGGIARDLLARRARWPHALLITGPEGVGKHDLARFLAQALLCENPSPQPSPRERGEGARSAGEGPLFPCGTCASCRYVAANQHPDLRVVEPIEVDDDGNATPVEWIVIDRIRALNTWVQLTSHRRVAKVGIIAPAERLFPNAADALLKTLEEPPSGTYLMLVSHQPGRLPPTIASRCVRLAIATPPAGIAGPWLKEHGVRDADALLAQAHGAPLRALALTDPTYQAERTAWLTALATPRALSPLLLSARIDAAPRDARKQRLAAAIDWLLAWSADLASVAAGGQPVYNVDFADRIRTLARSVARIPLFRYHRALLEQRTLVSHPLQPRLVAEALLIDYRALFT